MRLSLPKNMGKADRIIRGFLGITLVILGTLIVKGTIGIVLIVLSIPMLLTAIVGFCPGYVPLGISTERHETCC
jgi:hypothetical protein